MKEVQRAKKKKKPGKVVREGKARGEPLPVSEEKGHNNWE